jgi:hypothetical protein
VAQVALSLLLLIGAGLFVRTLHNLKSIDVGFRPEGVMTMLINPPDGAYQGERLYWFVERCADARRAAARRALSPVSPRSARLAAQIGASLLMLLVSAQARIAIGGFG